MNYVDNFLSFAAIGALFVALQAFCAAVWVVIGGMGGQWRVNQALSRQAVELRDLETRVTKAQNVRAGEKRQEGIREAKSIQLQAAEHLAAAGGAGGAPTRPSTLSSINGGS